jgi:hypothetical protein
MPRTSVVGTIAPPGSGAQQCAQASKREHIDAICHQCGKPLPATTRRHARFCSPAHRAAHHRSSIADRLPRVRFLTGAGGDNPAAMAYVAIVPDERFPGMYRLKRTDGSFSDMVNLTRARDARAEIRGRP